MSIIEEGMTLWEALKEGACDRFVPKRPFIIEPVILFATEEPERLELDEDIVRYQIKDDSDIRDESLTATPLEIESCPLPDYGIPSFHFINHFSDIGKSLLKTLLLLEQQYLFRDNHLPFVHSSCVFLETELHNLLANPIHSLTSDLIDVQKNHNKKYKTEALEGWYEGKVGTTLGLIVMIMCGLRWGLEQNRKSIIDFINEYFKARYISLIANKLFAQVVDKIRVKYRNPAFHGRCAEYPKHDYEELSKLITGFPSFMQWLEIAPASALGSDIGVLHNHLILRRFPHCNGEGGNY